MKKIIAIGLVLLFMGTALFAEDAKVMPKFMGRLYLAPTFITADKFFDEDGKAKDTSASGLDKMNMFNLGAALEFGVTDWLTLALQWAPGYNLWSEMELAAATAQLKDTGDLVLGAKMQLIGPAGLAVKNDTWRIAVAPGIKIPLPGPDFTKEGAKMLAGKDFTAGVLDRHSLGLGMRSYFDYIINENWFINFYNEFMFFPIKQKGKYAGLAQAMSIPNKKISHSYELTFSMEGVYTKTFSGPTILTAGLLAQYKTSPGYNTGLPTEDQKHLIELSPNVALFFVGWKLPWEFKFTYTAPLWGINENAAHKFGLQARMYFRIPTKNAE